MSEPITIESLPNLFHKGCQVPGCPCRDKPQKELTLSPMCHPQAGTTAFLTKGSNLLRMECRQCRRTVCEIMIGSNEQVVTVTA